jgi:signal transduction histidine kinase
MKIAARDSIAGALGRPLGGLERRARIGARWLALTALAVALTALGLILLLRPSPSDAVQIAIYLALSGIISVALGQGALWLADAARLGGVWLRMLLPPAITILVIASNVLLVSWMMFIASEDARILLGFLLFGVALALMLSFSIASEMTGAITRIETGAQRIAAGDYAWRIGEDASGGAEELARLARWFNAMAQSVQSAFEQRQAAEDERRQVVAAVSHDLRTPLASVRAMIEAIDDGVVSDEATVRRYHHAIHAEIRRLSALIDDFFDLSRLESGAFTLRRERLALDDLLSDALEASQTQAERKGVRLAGQVEGVLPLVSVDARQLSRALTNLLQNALRYTGPGEAVLARATTLVDEAGVRWASIAIADSGAGIAPTDLPHIFERTYRGEASRVRDQREQASDTVVGAGLGLTIARGIVEAHGGSVRAISPLPNDLRALIQPLRAATSPYQGTALTFTLPALPPPSPAGKGTRGEG